MAAVAEQQQQQQQQAGSSSSASLPALLQDGAAELASLPPQQQLQHVAPAPSVLAGPAVQQLQEQVQRLSRMVAEQHSAVMEEVQFQVILAVGVWVCVLGRVSSG